jgi:predicted RNase H-like HicB family nuclease
MRVQDLPSYAYYTFFHEPSGEYVAECREIPGLSGIGETEAEALAELKEAVAGWLEVLEEDGLSFPPPEGFTGVESHQYDHVLRALGMKLWYRSGADNMPCLSVAGHPDVSSSKTRVFLDSNLVLGWVHSQFSGMLENAAVTVVQGPPIFVSPAQRRGHVENVNDDSTHTVKLAA